jgi:hypothetical protein
MNPWVILAAVAFYLASLAGVGYWQREDGAASTKAAYEARDNKALTAANEKIVELENHNRQVENDHAEMIAAIGEAHEKDRNALEALRIRDVAAARDGAIKLRDPGAKPAACGNPAAQDPAPAAERDVAKAGELSREAVGFLLGLAQTTPTATPSNSPPASP